MCSLPGGPLGLSASKESFQNVSLKINKEANNFATARHVNINSSYQPLTQHSSRSYIPEKHRNVCSHPLEISFRLAPAAIIAIRVTDGGA